MVTDTLCPFQTDPYLMERTLTEDGRKLDGNDRYQGYCADLADLVAQKVNFSYTIEPIHDNKYGEQDENGSWNGMVGALMRHVSRVYRLQT